MPSLKRFAVVAAAAVVLGGCQPQLDHVGRPGVDPISVDPVGAAPSTVEIGWDHLANRRHGSAIQIFHRQRALDPEAIEPLYGLALAYNGVGRADISDRYFAAAEARETRPARMLANLAYRDRQNGDFDRALERYERAVELEPDNRALACNLALTRKIGRAWSDGPPTSMCG